MTAHVEKPVAEPFELVELPARLHHNAFVTKDQEATRAFYEDIIGLPLVATWKESDELFGKMRTYCHTFYGLGDGSALAFFQFADAGDQEQFGPEMPFSPFQHIALKVTKEVQDRLVQKLDAAGWNPDQTYVLEHGYCRSLYTADPNGLLLEFTVDAEGVEATDAQRRGTARADLASWLAGDHTSNNHWR
ncbi:VOC family protein [Lentzea nigeriaca]|uniref:VOC family protein n=1 Tax=Lentzea nigeriaca TaxID=1128665 RepID=UPI001957EDF6|nr:VOC family protein [Lentzea nigeriaca]MBM7863117.1 catechol 2,3-dioxygenase-like lactoylglutathione lyase family enzyme [Lentzea nigeriaca]